MQNRRSWPRRKTLSPPVGTGRGRMPHGSRPAMARAHGVFSEMAPRNRALGDGGADQVQDRQLGLEANPADIVPLGTLSNSLTITTLLSVLGVCRDRFEAFGGFKVTSGAAGSG